MRQIHESTKNPKSRMKLKNQRGLGFSPIGLHRIISHSVNKHRFNRSGGGLIKWGFTFMLFHPPTVGIQFILLAFTNIAEL